MAATWYDLARTQIGVTETAGSTSNPVVVAYYKDAGAPEIKDDSVPWCAAFAGAMLTRSGYRSTGSLLAQSYLDWGMSLQTPMVGCVAVFKRGSASWQGHVGFFVREEGNYIVVLGGNQSDSVRESRYPKKDLLGYRWPDSAALPTATLLLRVGSKGEFVKKLQERLNYHGASPRLEADGVFGAKTEAAVRAFQKTNGLSVDGKVLTSLTSETWPLLLDSPVTIPKPYPVTSINRAVFYSKVRSSLFKGSIPFSAVTTIDAILDEWEKRNLKDLRHLAYMLATPFGEVGSRLECVREGFKRTDAESRAVVRNRSYGVPDPVTGEVYYGRCLVQLTWAQNYKTMGRALSLPLYENPDLALDLKNAVQIMFEGMLNAETGVGDFTGKSLEDYFNSTKEDWYNARRIINGTDRADEIARYGRTFYAALLDAVTGAPEENPTRPVPVASTIVGGAAGAVAAGTLATGGGLTGWPLALVVGAAFAVVAFIVMWTTED